MARKKKDLEEKLDTQVINLQAIKEAASTEKKEKKKRSTSLLLFFLGLFMIVMGILYPIIMDTIKNTTADKLETNKVEGEKEDTSDDTKQKMKNQLTCNLNQVSEGLNSTSSSVFEFNEAGLIKVSTITKMTATTEETKQQIVSSATALNTIYSALTAKGIETNVVTAPDNGSLSTTLSVDYNVFDLEQYNAQNPNSTFSISYIKGMTKGQVQQQMIATGATCK